MDGRQSSPSVPSAELCGADKRCVVAKDLPSIAALQQWLQDRFPSSQEQQLSAWGKLPGTKSVANLHLELSEGEISLEDSTPPKRIVNVACVQISNGSGKMLLEACQEMADGSMRDRNRPLSEKMKPGESFVDACLRGIREELGLEYGASEHVQVLENTYEREVEERESLSYPGLMTRYVLHHVVVIMKDLPADDFVTEENELCESIEGRPTSGTHKNKPVQAGVGGSSIQHISANGVSHHFWKWEPEQTFQKGRRSR